MKKIGILNQPISSVIAGLGHTDTLVIADAGLPIPAETQRIDLALTEGIPSLIDTVSHLVLKEQTHSARAVIRTGESAPYASIILAAGVVF